MKRLLMSFVAAALVSPVFADPATPNRSSFTATNDGAHIAAMYLDKVIVGVASTGGVLKIYSSTHTTSVLISSISLATVATHNFENLAVKGIYYVTNSNANGVTILYKR